MPRKIELDEDMEDMLEEPIAELPGLSVRTANALDARDIYTVEDLLDCCALSQEECDRSRKLDDERDGKCPYCGDYCPGEPEDSDKLCDGFAGDIDGLVAQDPFECKKRCQCEREYGRAKTRLLDIKNFGKKTLKEVFECLKKAGFPV